ncbi:MAG: glucosidase [Phycisphaerales bacterium]
MTDQPTLDPESVRLAEDSRRERFWKHWGTYLPQRQWGTVREDYSADGDCWGYLPHDHARSRAYRWGEDGLLGLCDRYGILCFAPALWNGRDPILKERLFGLTNTEGNHGEDVKECYFFIDATPTGSYMKALYKYPHAEFPYDRLVAENRGRSRHEGEYELVDTGIFDESRYFDVFVEYAKADPDDILVRLTIANRGPEAAPIHVLPQLWLRNTWAWGRDTDGYWPKGSIERLDDRTVAVEHVQLGRLLWLCDAPALCPGATADTAARLLFTENETNEVRLFGAAPDGKPKKDAFHEFVVRGEANAVAVEPRGTKAAFHHVLAIPAGGEVVLRLRLVAEALVPHQPFGRDFDDLFARRIAEADGFYATRLRADLPPEERRVARQAYAGLLWSKQFYNYVVKEWLEGDPTQPAPPPKRRTGRNAEWGHLFNRDIISMPDTWEYPWYAAWDLAFQLAAIAHIDPHFAKEQLVLFMREWYMDPSGMLPAYEFAFSDVNPPVHAWATLVVYGIGQRHGDRDIVFLERCFQKLLINFTWWVNRKDPQGRNLFAGGFLGMDNIGLFDRSNAVPEGMTVEQADGTAWMAFYCLCMLRMAIDLASASPAYEDVASKFFEHFVAVADAINTFGGTGLWDKEDGFYYDGVEFGGTRRLVRVRSVVGLIPIIAFGMLPHAALDRLPAFRKRMDWFIENRPDLAAHTTYCEKGSDKMMLALPSRERLERMLRYVLDENEFLSPHGLRSVSKYHLEHPFTVNRDGQELRVDYEPGESSSGVFGGNSNWRGPVWFPPNYLIIRALVRYHQYYGDTFKVECPVGSGRQVTLDVAAREIAHRMIRLFLPDANGRRPCHGDDPRFAKDPHWKDLVLFHEYFHGDNGRGLGASHQTGWTALVTMLIDEFGPVDAAGAATGAPDPAAAAPTTPR